MKRKWMAMILALTIPCLAQGEELGLIERKAPSGEMDLEDRAALKAYEDSLVKEGRLTRVTIERENSTVSRAVEDLNSQTKLRQIAYSDEVRNKAVETKATFKLEKAPYNQAVWEISKAIEGSPDRMLDGKTWNLRSFSRWGKSPASIIGGNIVELNSFTSRKTLEYADGKRTGKRAMASLEMTLDPAIRPIFGLGFSAVEAIDEHGNKLKIDAQRRLEFERVINDSARHRTLEFPVPDKGEKLATLKGWIAEYAAYDYETWTIEGIEQARGATCDFGAMRMTILEVTASGNGVGLKGKLAGIVLPKDVKINEDQQVFLANVLRGDLFGIESNGNRGEWEPATTSGGMREEKERPGVFDFEFTARSTCKSGSFKDEARARLPLAPADNREPIQDVKISIRAPRKIGEIGIGFVFKDLELP